MIGTESKLWDSLKRVAEKDCTRIETNIAAGVSDVDYVRPNFHGWIELKTAHQPRPGRPYSLHCPFTLAQCTWLNRHHKPFQGLRSWVLLGIQGTRTWAKFILIPAPLTTHILQSRKAPAHEWLLKRKGVHELQDIREVMTVIDGN